jgi:hypothetical protein
MIRIFFFIGVIGYLIFWGTPMTYSAKYPLKKYPEVKEIPNPDLNIPGPKPLHDESGFVFLADDFNGWIDGDG